MTHQSTPPRPQSVLRGVLRSPLARRARHQAVTVTVALAGRLRLAAAASVVLVVAAGAALIGGLFALAALVRGLEQVMPAWMAFGATAAILLTGAALAAGAAVWTVVRLTRSPRLADSTHRSR
ncbi:hypothetical protein [Nocardia sp. NPDC050717]|uniref:hypothetical protein n=1 Tax=Nocardia sp. NPDC050717 TaxID=3157221 RepID=UPI0033E2D75B